MNKITKLSIMIVISLLFSKGAAYPNVLIAKDTTKTLQMEISLSSSQFLLGEPVMLVIIIKNIGSKPVRLPLFSMLQVREATILPFGRELK
ncbi:MAG: hypothetical protein A2Y62_09730 [Candidatus Fischerbacteria bacterium RBG_13_37_8]|uniref:Uncharacterized protein n=1 Tax=Candidatus Fischerbacteria bacterium RBG_13_37_8 TaxID=1817863 RepID=A0A1F5V5T5_9BACT|nr:MAG: hypothetical protein A2Y62_09730 [Candidatus Fischerbacteria bacterium RBG_13_37_8]